MTADELAKEVGTRLVSLRTSRELTQSEVAERADLSVSYIGMLERGDRLPHIDVLHRVAQVLGVPVATFFSDEQVAQDIDDARFVRPIVTVVRTLKLAPSDVLLSARVVWALFSEKGKRSPV